MDSMPIKALYQGGTGEIVEKKSRFIATTESIANEEEAFAFINRIKKQYWDARHNCYAFVAGKSHSLQRFSDDGEPGGTAGRPMLDVLLKEDIHDAAVVVTRYFGGVLLGTGGLVRAYQKAAQEGLSNSLIIEKHQGRPLKIDTDYNGIGKIQHILSKRQVPIVGTSYTERVLTEVMASLESLGEIQDAVTEATNGAARFQLGDTVEYALIDGSVKIF